MTGAKTAVIGILCTLLAFPFTSCSNGKSASSAPVNPTSGTAEDSPSAQIVYGGMDRRMFDSLGEIEAASDAIVECIGQRNMGQSVATYYDPKFKKAVPTIGYTFWEMKVTNVFKGSAKSGDRIQFAQAYYVWTENNGVKERICHTAQKPLQVGREYLLFLLHDKNHGDYVAAGDYQGRYAVPSAELKAKGLAGTVTQNDLDMYDNEKHPEMRFIYKDVVQKYFGAAPANVPNLPPSAVSSHVRRIESITDDSPDAEFFYVKRDQRKYDDQPKNRPDYHVYKNLQELEAASDIIAECVVQEMIDQRVSVTYNSAFQKKIPSFGFTTWGVKVTKAYKGNPPGMVLAFDQPYCAWADQDGKRLRICSTLQKPAQAGQKLLLFLKAVPDYPGYTVTGDCQGKYGIPSDALKAKGLAGTATQSDLDMYDCESCPEISALYQEVVRKYFS